ncbi:T7SS effector LXG polymorphic toxin [Priestia koreensis]|uniref:T7SS effector LXG polymorphic toxin n=1 Tax=Priestia koreensis TaxID=284581 RepID=UPI00301A92E6
MQNAIYEASTLSAAAKERVAAYTSLKDQIKRLKTSFQGITSLENDFKGKGANNIKAFYKAHIEIADQWLNLIETHIAFFKTVHTKMAEAHLAGETFVAVPFLEQNLDASTKQAKKMVADQKDALQGIFHQIDDILSLSVFSSEQYDKHIDDSDTKRLHTIEAVDELDQDLVGDYDKMKQFYDVVNKNIQALINATKQNGSASPMFFNSKSYHASEAYQLTKGADAEAVAYVKEKKAERKAHADRIKAKKEAALEKKRLAEEAKRREELGFLAPFADAWDDVSGGVQHAAHATKDTWDAGVDKVKKGTEYVVETAEKSWDGFSDGAGDAIGDTWHDAVQLVTHPIETGKNIAKGAKAVWDDPTGVAKSIGQSIAKSWNEQIVHGDAESRAHALSYIATSVAIGVLGTKGVDKVSKVSKLEKLSKLSKATKSHTEAISNRTQTKLEALLRNPNSLEDRLVGEGYWTASRQGDDLPSHRNQTPPANNRRSVDPPKPRTVVEKVSKAQLESLKNKKGAQYKVDGNRKIERVESTKGTGNSIQYAETGGRNISPEQFFKEEAIAEEMYEKFRNLGTEDVNAIAKNTGFSVARIQRIKDHVFNNSHIKDYGFERFDPDYELAQAWQRLIDGKQVDSDIQLLHHEIFESKFEGIFQTNYRTAHDKTIESGRPWNWEKNYEE